MPAHTHLPVAIDDSGQKLSKKTGALPLGRQRREQILIRALAFLGQDPPAELAQEGLAGILSRAVERWDPTPLKNLKKIRIQAN